MDSIGDILESRADKLGGNTYDAMTEVKLVVSRIVRVEVRILSIKNNIVKIATEDAPSASEIRLNKSNIMSQLASSQATQDIKNIVVVIR